MPTYLYVQGAEPVVSTIGIKIANGEFYSILEENSPVKKRLVLTTVHDKQRSVQIDLYKSHAGSMHDAQYIGSLVMENIKPRPKGEPSIELVISSSENGEILADAVDLDTTVQGEHQTLNVSLKSLDEDNREFEIPDFELEQGEPPPTGLLGKAAEVKKEKEKKAFPWVPVLCVVLALALIGLAIWFFFLKDGGSIQDIPARVKQLFQGSGKPATSAPVTPASPATQAAPPPQAPPPPAPPPPPPPPPQVIQAPAQAPAATAPVLRERTAAPVASYKVPSVIPREGAPYTIRWGDTLWDIAEAFYRNPWLYPRIARFNNIRNPDLIISGTTIRVPPRN